MTDQDPPQPSPPNPSATPTTTLSPDDLAGLLAAAGGVPSPEPPPSKSALRKKLVIAVLVAGIGVGASAMSCVGQSFSYRQAHALEGIEQQLKEIRASCPATAVEHVKSP